MSRKINLVGQRFGRLIVVSSAEKSSTGRAHWNCMCDCGNTKTTSRGELRSGSCMSCGCLRKDMLSEMRFKHGESKSKEYCTWSHVRQKCSNPNNPKFYRYGARGIKVCERWDTAEGGYKNFLADMGKAPSPEYTIERVDNDGNYCPENCIWATRNVQAMNTHRSLKFEWKGKLMTLPQIAHAEGKRPKHVYQLVKKYKKSIEFAVQKAKAA